MDKSLIFDLLEFPVAPLGNGDVAVFGGKTAVRHVRLRESAYAVKDVAVDQSQRPWLLSERELFCLVESGKHELAFDISALGYPLSGQHFHPSIVDTGAAIRTMAVNTNRGTQLLELKGRELRALTESPLPFVACCSYEDGDRVHFGGMTLRSETPGSKSSEAEVKPGRPSILSLDLSSAKGKRSFAVNPLEQFASLDRWRNALPVELKQSPVVIAGRLVPEVCVAVSHRRPPVFLVGFIELPSGFDPLDGLAVVSPRNSELIGTLLLSGDATGNIVDFELYRSVLGALSVRGKDTYIYVGTSRGHGASIGSIVRINMDAPTMTPEKTTIADLDPSALCSSFRPRFHSAIGYFAAATVKPIDGRPLAYFLQSDDGRRWRVAGREGSVPVVDP